MKNQNFNLNYLFSQNRKNRIKIFFIGPIKLRKPKKSWQISPLKKLTCFGRGGTLKPTYSNFVLFLLLWHENLLLELRKDSLKKIIFVINFENFETFDLHLKYFIAEKN